MRLAREFLGPPTLAALMVGVAFDFADGKERPTLVLKLLRDRNGRLCKSWHVAHSGWLVVVGIAARPAPATRRKAMFNLRGLRLPPPVHGDAQSVSLRLTDVDPGPSRP